MNILFLCLFTIASFAFEVPPFTPNVVDQTGKLSGDEIAQINSTIQGVQREGTLIGVLMTDTLGGESIDEVASKVFHTWKLGEKGKDNGVLILVAVNDRKMRIEVGYGLEGRITDVQSQDVIQNSMKPNFKAGNFGEGIRQAVMALGTLAKGEYPAYAQKDEFDNPEIMERFTWWNYLMWGLPAAIGIAGLFLALFANSKFLGSLFRNDKKRILWQLAGLGSGGGIGVKIFLYVNPGLFIVLFPPLFGDDILYWILNIVGVIVVAVYTINAFRNSLELFSEKRYVTAKEKKKDKKNKKGEGWGTFQRNTSSWGSDTSYSSSSSDSSWSSSDSSSSSSDSSSSSGGDSGGGGSSGDW